MMVLRSLRTLRHWYIFICVLFEITSTISVFVQYIKVYIFELRLESWSDAWAMWHFRLLTSYSNRQNHSLTAIRFLSERINVDERCFGSKVKHLWKPPIKVIDDNGA